MSVDVSPELPPQNLYQAADWLRARHPFLDELVRRIAGDSQEWLDEVAGAILDTVDNGAAWVKYGQEHRAPTGDDEDAYYRWEESGPENSPRGCAYAVMSGGEGRVIQLVATFANLREDGYAPGTYEYTSYQRFVPWSAHNLGGWDERGAAIFNDWVRILTSQVI